MISKLGYFWWNTFLFHFNLSWLTKQNISLRSMLLAVSLLLYNLYVYNSSTKKHFEEKGNRRYQKIWSTNQLIPNKVWRLNQLILIRFCLGIIWVETKFQVTHDLMQGQCRMAKPAASSLFCFLLYSQVPITRHLGSISWSDLCPLPNYLRSTPNFWRSFLLGQKFSAWCKR